MQPETVGSLEILPWTEDSEVSLIQSMDIGLMPLPETPWTRGKCAYKLIQYMACGLPVVASPVGVNCEVVEHGVNGFLAATNEEWRSAVETLMSDADLRRRMGNAGRKKVEESYSLQVWGPRVAQMLRRVADEGRKV
jgi:glycosyltransferase involved in cell wall biosynthesis